MTTMQAMRLTKKGVEIVKGLCSLGTGLYLTYKTAKAIDGVSCAVTDTLGAMGKKYDRTSDNVVDVEAED